MKKKESIFKEKVLRDLKKLGPAYFFKTQERGRRGVPDIIGCLNGKFFALELKTDVGDLDRLQREILVRIRAASGFAIETCPAQWPHDFELLKETLK